jgi:hypothetical protein
LAQEEQQKQMEITLCLDQTLRLKELKAQTLLQLQLADQVLTVQEEEQEEISLEEFLKLAVLVLLDKDSKAEIPLLEVMEAQAAAAQAVLEIIPVLQEPKMQLHLKETAELDQMFIQVG